ncbi:MAG: hypothetical protein ACREDJ_10215, partial [Methylocella sp.]
MPESLGSISGFLITSFKVISHILLLLVHNLFFVAIAGALLYGIFKLGRSVVRPARRTRGEESEDGWLAADQSQYASEQSSSTMKQSEPSPEGNLTVPQQSEPAQEQSQV